jgi:hypothetical protein
VRPLQSRSRLAAERRAARENSLPHGETPGKNRLTAVLQPKNTF